MNRDQAMQAAQQLGIAPGDDMFLQSQGQIENPHPHHGQTSGPDHVDGWHAWNNDGAYGVKKIHSDDGRH